MQVAERWILARLRHETFFSLRAMNERIAERLALYIEVLEPILAEEREGAAG